MDPGANMSSKALDDFVNYCGRLDPTFPGRISGASGADIELIENMAKMHAPPEYRRFLEYMGRTAPGSLGRFLANIDFGIEAVRAFYLDPPIPIPSDAIYLWTLDADVEMFLDTTAKRGGQRPVLHFTWAADPGTGKFIGRDRRDNVISSSLLRFLYKEAFIEIRNRILPYHAELREHVGTPKPNESYTNQRREQFRSLAERLGCTAVPHIDNDLAFYDRSDASLMLFSHDYAADAVYAAADDQRELARLCDITSDNLGLYLVG